MKSLREEFGLSEYSEELIRRIVDYRMIKDINQCRYLSCEEIAEKENCTVDDVKKILRNTALIWCH